MKGVKMNTRELIEVVDRALKEYMEEWQEVPENVSYKASIRNAWDRLRNQLAVKEESPVTEVKTTSLFWDCECLYDYIKPSAQNLCTRCQSMKKNQPESRTKEVISFLYHEYERANL